MPADLHCHSVISDGTANVIDIVQNAERLGLNAVAVTDHDDFSAFYKAPKAGVFSVYVIKGAEISARDNKTGRRVHILCYLPQNEKLLENMLKTTRERRRAELERSLDIISEYYPVNFLNLKLRRGAYEGYFKQQVMQFLMELGYCDRIFGDLFYKLFDKKDGIAPTKVEYPDVYDVLSAIKEARGIAVMAHPAVYDSFDLLKTLCRDGLLDGIEVQHPKQNAEERDFLRSIAEEYNLLQTGGSDFHGYNTSAPAPLGTCTTTDEQINRIFELSMYK